MTNRWTILNIIYDSLKTTHEPTYASSNQLNIYKTHTYEYITSIAIYNNTLKLFNCITGEITATYQLESIDLKQLITNIQ